MDYPGLEDEFLGGQGGGPRGKCGTKARLLATSGVVLLMLAAAFFSAQAAESHAGHVYFLQQPSTSLANGGVQREAKPNLRSFTIGDLITLQNVATSQFLKASKDHLSESRFPNINEFFQVESGRSEGFLKLRSRRGTYVQATDSGQIILSLNGQDKQCEFELEFVQNDVYRLRTLFDNYLSVSTELGKQRGSFPEQAQWRITKVIQKLPSAEEYYKGVNLGGWLVIESWMTDYLMDGAPDEWTLVANHGGPQSQEAIDLLHQHWDTFITERDLDDLKNFGITHVRIPIGWWIVDWRQDDGFVDGGWFYLDRLLGWLGQRGMRAIIDVHAMPGAQSPYQGFTGKIEDRAYFFERQDYLQRGKELLVTLASKIKAYEQDQDYRKQNVIVGLEVVNEPSEQKWGDVQNLYQEMVPKLRGILSADRYAIFLSIMNMPRDAVSFLRNEIRAHPNEWQNVLLDRHVYHAYGDDDVPPWDPSQQRPPWTNAMDPCKTCCRDPVTLKPVDPDLSVVIGEWALNTATLQEKVHPNATKREFLSDYFAKQISLWRHAATGGGDVYTPRSRGFFFWSAKIHDDGGGERSQDNYYIQFDLLKMIRRGYLGTSVDAYDVSKLCPGVDRSHCPHYDVNTVAWNDNCNFK